MSSSLIISDLRWRGGKEFTMKISPVFGVRGVNEQGASKDGKSKSMRDIGSRFDDSSNELIISFIAS